MKRRPAPFVTFAGPLAACLALLSLAPSPAAAQDEPAESPDQAAAEDSGESAEAANQKLYELRIYTTNEGKFDALLARFRDHTMALFEKHGIENIIYFTVVEGAGDEDPANTLVYIIAHKDQQAADASWEAFLNDPDWIAAKEASEADGPLLVGPPARVFMKPTDFCPEDFAVNKDSDAPARLFQLRKYNDGPAALPNTVERFASGEAELFRKHGFETPYFWTATDDSAFIYLLASKDRETFDASWEGFVGDFQEFFAGFNARNRGGGAARGGRGGGRGAGRGAGRGFGGGQRGGRAGGRRGGRGGGAPAQEIRYLAPTDFSPRK